MKSGKQADIQSQQERKGYVTMATIDFGGVKEEVITRDEFPHGQSP